jgi:hypothetical protein
LSTNEDKINVFGGPGTFPLLGGPIDAVSDVSCFLHYIPFKAVLRGSPRRGAKRFLAAGGSIKDFRLILESPINRGKAIIYNLG